MTLRRYVPPRASAGTTIPPSLREAVVRRDAGCVGLRVGMPGDCVGAIELDHVRASHGIGMKSETSAGNLVSLCGAHHRYKTSFGREARPLLLAYLSGVSAPSLW
jgi:hypothetical protein